MLNKISGKVKKHATMQQAKKFFPNMLDNNEIRQIVVLLIVIFI